MDCSDILRSALMLSISSFDLFMHEIHRLEILERLKIGQEIPALKVPYGAAITSGVLQMEIVDEYIRRENSYKSFVAPDKVGDCLRIIMDNPWDKISAEIGQPAAELKSNLKRFVDLRNRIAHEADVNPAYAGIALWPIYSEDVSNSISFIRNIGLGISKAVNSNST
nr:HEPN domain-containing protein [Ancylobacter tetraedralis]